MVTNSANATIIIKYELLYILWISVFTLDLGPSKDQGRGHFDYICISNSYQWDRSYFHQTETTFYWFVYSMGNDQM